MEAGKPATDTIKIVDDCMLMLHASRLFTEAVNDDSLVSVLDDGQASEHKVWQIKCNIAKHVIDKDKEKAEKMIRDLYCILVDEISKMHQIKLLEYEVRLSRPQIEQTIGDVIYELFKAVSESNNSSSTHIQRQNGHPLLRFTSVLGKNQLVLIKNDKLQLRVRVFYDMVHSYYVYYYGSEDELRQLTFADLRKSLKDKVKYSYVFADRNKILKDSDKIWKISIKNYYFVISIANFWPDMTCIDQDQLVSCLDDIGYDKIQLIKFKFRNRSKYILYSTFQSLGLKQSIMLFCELLPEILNSKISKEDIEMLRSALIKEYSTHDDTPSLELNIADIINKIKADHPTLSVAGIIGQSQTSSLTSFDDRLRIISDMSVDISDSHHYVCMIDNHSGPQATTDMIDADMKAKKYNLVYDCKTPGRHVCVYEKCDDEVNKD